MANKAALQEAMRARFCTAPTAHWLARLEAEDLLCAPVRSLEHALADPQTAVNGMILEAPGSGERVRVVGSPVHLGDATVAIRRPPPALGADTNAVLAELGLGPTVV